MALLVAEYQALNLRQKGHGRIWRFFHGQENDKRTQLLEDMEKAIIKAVGKQVNLEPTETSPSDIAMLLNNKLIEKKSIKASKPDEFANRYNITGMVIYEPSELEINLQNQINPNVQNIIVDEVNNLDNEVMNNQIEENDLENEKSKQQHI